jgi:hypothetical protein
MLHSCGVNLARRLPLGCCIVDRPNDLKWYYKSERAMQQAIEYDPRAPEFELRFQSLFNPGAGYAFPCDASGNVDLDALSDNGRNHYFFARTVVGCELSLPTVRLCSASSRYKSQTSPPPFVAEAR